MLAVIQKVSSASVEVESKIVGQISTGYCILLGINKADTDKDIDYLVEKISRIKLFENGDKRFKDNLITAGASVLIVPQYTLYGNLKSKNSPSFTEAMAPDEANVLFDKFCTKMGEKGIHVEKGAFREFMKVNIVNEGPVTFILDSDHLKVNQKNDVQN